MGQVFTITVNPLPSCKFTGFSELEGNSDYLRRVEGTNTYHLIAYEEDMKLSAEYCDQASRKLNVSDKVKNGTFEITNKAYVDEYVCLTAKPADGYHLKKDSICCYPSNKNIVLVQDLSDENKFYFTMPDCDVEIYAEFQTNVYFDKKTRNSKERRKIRIYNL